MQDDPGTRGVRTGDLWELGGHRLLCGDCTNPEHVRRLMDGERAAMLFTDPPYGIRYTGKSMKRSGIQNDNLSQGDTRNLVVTALRLAPLRPGGAFYICSSAGPNETLFRLALADAGLELRQCLVWAKNHFVISRSDYHWKHESILYGWKGGAPHYFVADRRQHTLWEYPKPQRSPLHPTMKPVELVRRAIGNSSLPGETVFDGFGGSGTTLIACELLGRRCRMMEIDPGYCQVIVQRWTDEAGATGSRRAHELRSHSDT